MPKRVADENYKYTIDKNDILIRDSYQKFTYASIKNNYQNIKFPCNVM